MPYARKKYRRRRRKTGGKKSIGKSLLRDSKKRGTNSALEAAVKSIAKKEALKLLPPNRIFRRFYFANYDRDTNIFSAYTDLDWDGNLVHIVQMPKMDGATAQSILPTVDGDVRGLFPGPASDPYSRGTNLIAPFVPLDGFRTGTVISIKNISCRFKFHLVPLGVNAPIEEYVTVHWAIVVTSDIAQLGLAWSPAPEEVMAVAPFGYSSRLDTDIKQQTSLFKSRTLKRGSVRLRYNVEHRKEKLVKLFLKTNMRYEFSGLSQNGQQTEDVKLFCVFRSSCPAAANTVYKPKCAAVIKIGYKDL